MKNNELFEAFTELDDDLIENAIPKSAELSEFGGGYKKTKPRLLIPAVGAAVCAAACVLVIGNLNNWNLLGSSNSGAVYEESKSDIPVPAADKINSAPEPQNGITKIYDYESSDGNETTFEINNRIFSVDSTAVYSVRDGNGTVVISGNPVKKVYTCDLNGDGVPEICAEIFDNSGASVLDSHIKSSIRVYDTETGQLYVLPDGDNYDLSLEIRDGTLIAVQTNFNGDSSQNGGMVALSLDIMLKVGSDYEEIADFSDFDEPYTGDIKFKITEYPYFEFLVTSNGYIGHSDEVYYSDYSSDGADAIENIFLYDANSDGKREIYVTFTDSNGKPFVKIYDDSRILRIFRDFTNDEETGCRIIEKNGTLYADCLNGNVIALNEVYDKYLTFRTYYKIADFDEPSAETVKFTAEEFEGGRVTVTANTIRDGGIVYFTSGNSAATKNIYLYDANNDGYREIYVTRLDGDGDYSVDIYENIPNGGMSCNETGCGIFEKDGGLYVKYNYDGSVITLAEFYDHLYEQTNENMVSDGGTYFTLPDFLDINFYADHKEVMEGEVIIIRGSVINDVYVYDITGDGKYDICAAVDDLNYNGDKFKSYIKVYDIANHEMYILYADDGYFIRLHTNSATGILEAVTLNPSDPSAADTKNYFPLSFDDMRKCDPSAGEKPAAYGEKWEDRELVIPLENMPEHIPEHFSFCANYTLSADKGAEVRTVADGEIIYANNGTVIIRHADKAYTKYSRLDTERESEFNKGDKVKAGDVIGYTQNSNGMSCHLNYEFYFVEPDYIYDTNDNDTGTPVIEPENVPVTDGNDEDTYTVPVDGGFITAKRTPDMQ